MPAVALAHPGPTARRSGCCRHHAASGAARPQSSELCMTPPSPKRHLFCTATRWSREISDGFIECGGISTQLMAPSDVSLAQRFAEKLAHPASVFARRRCKSSLDLQCLLSSCGLAEQLHAHKNC